MKDDALETLESAGRPGMFYIERGQPACRRPQVPHRTMRGPHGVCCPGCNRVCLVPGVEAGVLIKVLEARS